MNLARIVCVAAVVAGLAYLGYTQQYSGEEVYRLEVPMPAPPAPSTTVPVPVSSGAAAGRVRLSPAMNPVRVLIRGEYLSVGASTGRLAGSVGGLTADVSLRSSDGGWSWRQSGSMAGDTPTEPGVHVFVQGLQRPRPCPHPVRRRLPGRGLRPRRPFDAFGPGRPSVSGAAPGLEGPRRPGRRGSRGRANGQAAAPPARVTPGSYRSCWKKSFPLSSTRMKAGKSTTSIAQMASIPSSGYSRTSTFRMCSSASSAAGPPGDPR